MTNEEQIKKWKKQLEEYDKNRIAELEAIRNTPSVPMASSTKSIDASSTPNRNALGSFLSSLVSTPSIADKFINDLKNDEELSKKAKQMGYDINSLKTPQDTLNEIGQNITGGVLGGVAGVANDAAVNTFRNDPNLLAKAKAQGLNTDDLKTTKEKLDLFGADVDRTFEAFGQGLKSSGSNLGKGTLLFARDMGGATALADKLTNEYRNKSDRELEEIAKKANISTQTLKDYVSKAKTSYENINDFSANTFDKWANEANQRIAEIQGETQDEFAKKAIGFMPNLSQQAITMGASLVNPVLGTYVASGQAKGSYFNDAKERGMTDEQANNYSTVMAGVEGVTEMLSIKNMIKAGKGAKALAKGGIKGAVGELTKKELVDNTIKGTLKSYGKGILENAVQEAITEPIQEAVADMTAGKGNWENIGQRMIEAGINGAISSAITGGANMGIQSCVEVTTNPNATQEEINQAYVDVISEVNNFTPEQKAQYQQSIAEGAEYEIQQEKARIEAENEQNKTNASETNENALTEEQTKKLQEVQDEIENASKLNLEAQNQEQTQENQAQEENVQENLTEEEKIQKTQEKLTEKYGEETAQKLLNNFSPEEINNITNINEDLNNKTQNDTISEEQQLVERYENNKQEAENEFRRLQEESRGMSEDESELYRRGSKKIDDNLRTRLQRVLGGRVQSATSNVSNDSRVLTDSKTGNQFKVYSNVDGKTFHDVFEIARSYTENGELVDLHPIETNEDATGYNDTKNYLSADGMSGYAITKDGDLISVFNANPGKRGWLRAIAPDIKKNAKTLDCYISPNQDLSKMYSKIFGFKIASEMDYNMEYDHDNIAQNHSEPQVAFMVNTDQDVQTQMFTKDDYDGAYNYQQSFVNSENTTNVENTEVKPVEENRVVKNPKPENNILSEDTLKEYKEKGLTDKVKEETIKKIINTPPSQRTENQHVLLSLLTKLVDKNAVFENLAKKTKNRQLEATADTMLLSQARAQYAIGQERTLSDGTKVPALETIMSNWNDIVQKHNIDPNTIDTYMYHLLNTDRMSLQDRGFGENKAVFGDDVTADMSRDIIKDIEKKYPEIKQVAEDIYKYNKRNLEELVNSGVISQDLAKTFGEMYPHYVPISRVDAKNNAISVPLDTNRTGINAPIQKAKGGSGDIQSLFTTMENRTNQVYRASDRNAFGLELRKSLKKAGQLNEAVEGSTVETILDGLQDINDTAGITEAQGQNPTFTVFENGEKVTYEISPDMFEALKPRNPNGFMSKFDNSKASKVLRGISNFRRGLLTEYNPVFALTNAIKDAQDVLYNSQHAKSTYKNFPEAYQQIIKRGHWYQEYLEAGGEQNRYSKDGQFENFNTNGSKKDVPKWKKAVKFPLETISNINNVIETAPRLAEYIASREQGKSIQESMLDASRVTTNFKAGGDVTKFANRNGVTFLNASVQGLAQNVRNIREANQKGIKGYATLLAKTVVAGTPALILNGLVWKDDEDYEELSDYVKDNYYIIGKVGDTFIRIPKGRVVAVVQDMVANVQDYMTGDKELDGDKVAKDLFGTLSLAGQNLAPNNPLENNILSPIINVATNKTWYGSDLVPTRLQDEKPENQYDESTDEFSKWLGQTMGWSPIKINYLLDQYGGGIADVLLPMGTPQAETTNVFTDKFTADATMKNGNAGRFYDLKNSLDTSSTASDEDKLKVKYANKVNSELNDLYKQKREIQMSDNTDEYKVKAIKDVQSKINEIAKNAVKELEKVDKSSVPMSTNSSTETSSKSSSSSASSSKGSVPMSEEVKTIGEYTYYKDSDGNWKSLTNADMKKNSNAGISNSAYAQYKQDIQGISDNKEKAEILSSEKLSDKEKSAIYETYIGKNDKTYQAMKLAGVDIDDYLDYISTYNGTTKQEFSRYINSTDFTYEQKLLLAGTKYKLSNAERNDLVKYINSLNLSEDEITDIYSRLKGATITSNGDIYY